MFKFPLRIPQNREVSITQPFHSLDLAPYYISLGFPAYHDAIDVAVGNGLETFGTPFVCPFTIANLVSFDDTGVAGTGKADRVQVKHTEPDGTTYILGGLHFSELKKQDTYAEGDIIGYIGNTGAVQPTPSPSFPYAGSHIHITCIVNGVVVDPLIHFDKTNPYRGADTGAAHDNTIFGPAPDETPQKFARSLFFGVNGVDVALLQDTLRQDGEFPVSQASTGHFGPITQKAVGDYQIKHGILTSITDDGYGICGPKTRALLNLPQQTH